MTTRVKRLSPRNFIRSIEKVHQGPIHVDPDALHAPGHKYMLIGKEGKERLVTLFQDHGLKRCLNNPDFVVVYGGDGTLLGAEHKFPGVPKLFVKHTRIGKLAQAMPEADLLGGFLRGNYAIVEHRKVEVRLGQKSLLGVNEVVLDSVNTRYAIRFEVYINDCRHAEQMEEIVGDGIVVATPIGSTGYYQSITRSSFKHGMGLSFKCVTEFLNHVVLDEADVITVRILRGPAKCHVDNAPEQFELRRGSKVQITMSDQYMKLIRVGYS